MVIQVTGLISHPKNTPIGEFRDPELKYIFVEIR
jgi:hypothetical protein